MTKKHTVKKLEDGSFEYRGVEFARVDRLKGYSDHYRTCGKVKGQSVYGATRRELLDRIDRVLDGKTVWDVKPI